jgi:hypothetical protein
LGEFSSHTRFMVGDGSKVKFGDDVWCRDQAFKIAFSYFYIITHFMEVAVADHLELSSTSH